MSPFLKKHFPRKLHRKKLFVKCVTHPELVLLLIDPARAAGAQLMQPVELLGTGNCYQTCTVFLLNPEPLHIHNHTDGYGQQLWTGFWVMRSCGYLHIIFLHNILFSPMVLLVLFVWFFLISKFTVDFWVFWDKYHWYIEINERIWDPATVPKSKSFWHYRKI